jgi:hypothetical protein
MRNAVAGCRCAVNEVSPDHGLTRYKELVCLLLNVYVNTKNTNTLCRITENKLRGSWVYIVVNLPRTIMNAKMVNYTPY